MTSTLFLTRNAECLGALYQARLSSSGNDRKTSGFPDRCVLEAARADVLGALIYGVDLNPAAVELTKINLWLFAYSPGRPNVFLAHHIKCGNALLGTTPALLRDVVGLLTAVGLSSPPAWLRPHHTLSNGEAFRATLARALAETDDLVVIDEFTSVVDRQVAAIASAALAKTIRRDRNDARRFVALTCHYDLLDWLQPDWVYDTAASALTWRSVQPRPRLALEIHPVDRSCWPVFAPHHYLSSYLNPAARCFGAFTDAGECVAFTSYLHFPHPKTRNIKIGHRRVVLPDWQGLGIGGALADWLGQHLWEQDFRYHSTVAHPAMIHHYTSSPRWREVSGGLRSLSSTSTDAGLRRRALNPRYLTTRSFEYTAPVNR